MPHIDTDNIKSGDNWVGIDGATSDSVHGKVTYDSPQDERRLLHAKHAAATTVT